MVEPVALEIVIPLQPGMGFPFCKKVSFPATAVVPVKVAELRKFPIFEIASIGTMEGKGLASNVTFRRAGMESPKITSPFPNMAIPTIPPSLAVETSPSRLPELPVIPATVETVPVDEEYFRITKLDRSLQKIFPRPSTKIDQGA